MNTLWQDIRHSLRILARNRGFTGVAILTLAIALGANTAVFSVVNGVLLGALPYPEADRLVDVSMLIPPSEGRPSREALLDKERLRPWRESTRTLDELAAYRTRSLTLSGRLDPERLTGAEASTTLFSLLLRDSALGRTFRDEDQYPGSEKVVVLSHALWQRRFHGDQRIIGEAVALNGVPHTVVGVMPRSFFFPRREVELWTPLVGEPSPLGATGVIATEYFPVLARLRDGVSLEQAEVEARTILESKGEGALEQGYQSPPGRIRLVPLRDKIVARVRPALWAMSAAVGLVVLIACINVANLLLARNSARQREMAIRGALGAGRARLVRQMLTESTVLSLTGGIAGMLLAGWVHRLLPRLLPHDIPRIEEVQLDGRVFAFSFLLSSSIGLLAGLLPALRSVGSGGVAPFRSGVAEAWRDPISRSLFVAAEVALAFVLLVGAGLLVRTLQQLAAVELGYEPNRVLTATLDLDPAAYSAPRRAEALFDEILGRLTQHAEVEAAGVVSFPPLTPGFSLTNVNVEGEPPERTLAVPQLTSPGYLQAIGLRLAEGRWLTPQDQAADLPVAVVTNTFARQYIADADALGGRLRVGSKSLEIVGVVEDVRLLGPASDARPEFFTSYRHSKAISGGGPLRLTLVIRTAGDPAVLLPFLRSLVQDLDPGLALEDVGTMKAKLSASLAQPRFYAALLSVFAGMALLLASAGVYGVLSYSVARQSRAIGVRRALGAKASDIWAMVFKKGLTVVTAGLLTGMAAAVGASRALAHLLFGVTTRDPLSYIVAALSLVGVAVLACYLPARRATLVNPIEALRHE